MSEATQRRYGIWGFVGVFTVIALLGLGALLIVGSPQGATDQVSTRQTLPDGAPVVVDPDDATDDRQPDGATGAGSESPDPASPTVTMPGGAPAPEGVLDVQSQDGVTSYTFDTPEGFGGSDLQAVVAPTGVVVLPDDISLRLTIGCAGSADERLAQVGVTEGESTITVAVIAVAPAGSPPCAQGAATQTLDVALTAPVAGRAVLVVPPGTAIPSIDAG